MVSSAVTAIGTGTEPCFPPSTPSSTSRGLCFKILQTSTLWSSSGGHQNSEQASGPQSSLYRNWSLCSSTRQVDAMAKLTVVLLSQYSCVSFGFSLFRYQSLLSLWGTHGLPRCLGVQFSAMCTPEMSASPDPQGLYSSCLPCCLPLPDPARLPAPSLLSYKLLGSVTPGSHTESLVCA